MAMQMVEVDVPDGWEVERVGLPKNGDRYLDALGNVDKSFGDTTTLRVIVRPAWVWPDYLLASWIAMDADGSWWAYAVEPQVASDMCWDAPRDYRHPRSRINARIIKFTPPPTADWKSSKRKNPNL